VRSPSSPSRRTAHGLAVELFVGRGENLHELDDPLREPIAVHARPPPLRVVQILLLVVLVGLVPARASHGCALRGEHCGADGDVATRAARDLPAGD
jgi:hypothetical protein